MVSLFNGIVRPYSDYPVFWKYWMYYLAPTTYWLRGILSSVLPPIEVHCASSETTHFTAPANQTCSQYAQGFVDLAGVGYLAGTGPNHPDISSNCAYCPFATGSEYMENLNVHHGDKWRCFGIFLGYVIFNWMLVYFMVYSCRVRGWSFGLGYVFGFLGMVVGKVKKGLKSLVKLVLRR